MMCEIPRISTKLLATTNGPELYRAAWLVVETRLGRNRNCRVKEIAEVVLWLWWLQIHPDSLAFQLTVVVAMTKNKWLIN